MDVLKQYLSNHPQDLKEWLDQFPWDSFGEEIIIHEDEEAKIAIAKNVVLHANAEVTGLMICQEADIGKGAEILGTMVCDKGRISRDAECNYLIAQTVTVGEDAEIKSAIVSDSLKVETGAEIDELEVLGTTFLDVHEHSLIKKKTELVLDDYRAAIKYFAIMSIPVVIGIFWFLWSVVYVPLRHFVWGYLFMVETCPSCKSNWGYKECPNCKGSKFLDSQCFTCGHQFDGFQRKCEECGTEGMKFRAERSFEFEEEVEID